MFMIAFVFNDDLVTVLDAISVHNEGLVLLALLYEKQSVNEKVLLTQLEASEWLFSEVSQEFAIGFFEIDRFDEQDQLDW